MTHIINEGGGELGRVEEWSVAGVFEVSSVLLKGRFVFSLLTRKYTFFFNTHLREGTLRLFVKG